MSGGVAFLRFVSYCLILDFGFVLMLEHLLGGLAIECSSNCVSTNLHEYFVFIRLQDSHVAPHWWQREANSSLDNIYSDFLLLGNKTWHVEMHLLQAEEFVSFSLIHWPNARAYPLSAQKVFQLLCANFDGGAKIA